MDAKFTPGIEKCCCGYASCKDYWLTDIGKFCQGSGFTLEEAKMLAAAPAMHKALILAEDVLARFPFTSEIWPNGTHPNTGIEQIRAAIRAATE